jgi:hypothetical protein
METDTPAPLSVGGARQPLARASPNGTFWGVPRPARYRADATPTRAGVAGDDRHGARRPQARPGGEAHASRRGIIPQSLGMGRCWGAAPSAGGAPRWGTYTNLPQIFHLPYDLPPTACHTLPHEQAGTFPAVVPPREEHACDRPRLPCPQRCPRIGRLSCSFVPRPMSRWLCSRPRGACRIGTGHHVPDPREPPGVYRTRARRARGRTTRGGGGWRTRITTSISLDLDGCATAPRRAQRCLHACDAHGGRSGGT